MFSGSRFASRWVVTAACLLMVSAAIAIAAMWLLTPPLTSTESIGAIGPVRISTTWRTNGFEDASAGPMTQETVWISFRDDEVDSVTSTEPEVGSRRTLEEPLYALPGLVDRHVHLPPRWLPGQSDFFRLMFLAHGVTTVRDMGSLPGDRAAFREAVQEGRAAGPEVLDCGTPLAGADFPVPFATVVENEADLDLALFQRSHTPSTRCIKVYRGFPVELLDQLRVFAKRHDLPVVGHLPIRSPWSESRVDEVQHLCDPRCGSFYQPAVDGLLGAAVDAGVRHTPTLAAFAPVGLEGEGQGEAERWREMPALWRDHLWSPAVATALGFGDAGSAAYAAQWHAVREATRRLIEAGATLHVGTDTPHPGVVPGRAVHEEMMRLVELGMSTGEVWRAATTIPGGSAGESPAKLQPGAPADLLLFERDPMEDLEALSSLRFVIAKGRVYEIEQLRADVVRVRARLESPLYRWLINPIVERIVRWVASSPSRSG